MKSGYVAIIGRPNSGKSTLLNNILGQKVSITSPKPQTTRFPIHAVYEDERGQIIFIDTPGIFARVEDPVSKKINPQAEKTLKEGIDVIVYLVDHTRDRDVEENKTLGLVRQLADKPKILAINKIDIKKPTFLPHYKFMEEEFDKTLEISGLYKSNLNYLVDSIFELLPTGEKLVDNTDRPSPVLNMNSKMFLADIIREKAYLFLRKEVPYTLTTVVDEIETHHPPSSSRKRGSDSSFRGNDNNPKDILYIKARIITSDDKYKKMIIGEKGRMVKEIGMAARKELETATNKKVYLDLTVETNPHWYMELG
ncbi:GTPase Era [Candidatus Gottesmanbacteria bacterium]|nr:GTPase Era [Candidatus Gottesmanbacteria bacterium]